METKLNRETIQRKVPNGAYFKRVLTKNSPENKELNQMLSQWSNQLPKVARFLRQNWKPIAIATASVAAVTVGLYALLSKPPTKAARRS